MKIEIYGGGCEKCKATEANAETEEIKKFLKA